MGRKDHREALGAGVAHVDAGPDGGDGNSGGEDLRRKTGQSPAVIARGGRAPLGSLPRDNSSCKDPQVLGPFFHNRKVRQQQRTPSQQCARPPMQRHRTLTPQHISCSPRTFLGWKVPEDENFYFWKHENLIASKRYVTV